MADMWNDDVSVKDLGIEVPLWIDQDITPYDVAAIIQGGCDSGAYMPAVTYSDALDTMKYYGDEVFSYLEDYEDLSEMCSDPQSWAGLACRFVSAAVELWAATIQEGLESALDEWEEENGGPG